MAAWCRYKYLPAHSFTLFFIFRPILNFPKMTLNWIMSESFFRAPQKLWGPPLCRRSRPCLLPRYYQKTTTASWCLPPQTGRELLRNERYLDYYLYPKRLGHHTCLSPAVDKTPFEKEHDFQKHEVFRWWREMQSSRKLCRTGVLGYKYLLLGSLLFFFITPTLSTLSKISSTMSDVGCATLCLKKRHIPLRCERSEPHLLWSKTKVFLSMSSSLSRPEINSKASTPNGYTLYT